MQNFEVIAQLATLLERTLMQRRKKIKREGAKVNQQRKDFETSEIDRIFFVPCGFHLFAPLRETVFSFGQSKWLLLLLIGARIRQTKVCRT